MWAGWAASPLNKEKNKLKNIKNTKFAQKIFYFKSKKRVVFLHSANTLACFFENSLCSKKYIIMEFEEKMYFSMDFTKKNHFSHFWILQHVCKIERVLANIPKKFKTPFLVIHIIHYWYLDK